MQLLRFTGTLWAARPSVQGVLCVRQSTQPSEHRFLFGCPANEAHGAESFARRMEAVKV